MGNGWSRAECGSFLYQGNVRKRVARFRYKNRDVAKKKKRKERPGKEGQRTGEKIKGDRKV